MTAFLQRRWFAIFALGFLAFSFASVALILRSTVYTRTPWSVAVWLFNYAGGFARRGLSGEAIMRLSGATGVSAIRIVLALTVAAHAAILALVGWLLHDRAPRLWLILLLLSPVTVAFAWLDTGGAGNKEVLHFVLLAAWVLRVRSGPMGPVSVGLFAAAAILATLCHEMIMVLSPFYAAAYWLQRRREGKPVSLPILAAIPAVSILTGLCIFVFGASGPATLAASCNDALTHGLPADICSGYLSFPNDLGSNLAITAAKISGAPLAYFAMYPAAALLAAAPLLLAWLMPGDRNQPGGVREFVLLALLCAACTAPLYIAAYDWGRWLNIAALSTLILGAAAAPRLAPAPSLAGDIRPPAIIVTMAALGVALYASTWALDQCCTGFEPGAVIRLFRHS